jgi:uncharacterized protein YdhG (YjbR/CyaY superfamily)
MSYAYQPMRGKPETIDEYLASVSPDRRVILENLRRTIRTIVPEAEECISYSMPAFRLNGHVVAGFLATQKGCSYFPFSGTTLASLTGDLARYDQTKSALHFDAKRPLSATLVRRLLKARISETKDQAAKETVQKPAQRSKPRAKRG